MAEDVSLWTCPRCGEQMASDITVCSRCHAAPSPFPVPPKRCPSCGAEARELAREDTFHCHACNTEFRDYEDWVRRCRVAAYAALRPPPPPVPVPPPRPARLTAVAGTVLACAAIHLLFSLLQLRGPLLAVGLALGAFQALAGVALLTEWRNADRIARLAVGLSALFPLFFGLAVIYAIVFWYLCDPPVVRYFGGRTDPAPDGARHALMAWVSGLAALVLLLFSVVVGGAIETAHRWSDSLPPVLDAGAAVAGFFGDHLSWTSFAAVAGLLILSIWGKINQTGFFWAAAFVMLGLVGLGGPPIVAAVFYERSAREAEALTVETSVNRLMWGLRETDPKKRIASARALETLGREARGAAPVLLQGLEDRDARVRLWSAAAVARLDPASARAVPVLVRVLEDPSSTGGEVELATRALAYLGPLARPAVHPLIEGFKGGDSGVQTLVEIGIAAIPELTDALKHRDTTVRRRAATTLRRIGPAARSAVPALTENLKDTDESVRIEAVAALGEVHRDKAVPMLLDLLRDDKALAKIAAETLCSLGERDGLSGIAKGGNFLNRLRRPVDWDHLSKTWLEKDLEGTGQELLQGLAERAVRLLDLDAECALESQGILDTPTKRALAPFRRIFAVARKRSVLEVLDSLGIDFVLESDRIRVLPPAQAASFWVDWLKSERNAKK